ncbi:MAG: polymorphic toxin type 24 domain-containing protein [Thermoleophilia bacterium]
MAGWVSEQSDRWKHGAGIVWNSYLSPVVNVVFDDILTLADPAASWSESGIAIVFLASGGVGKAAKGIKLADDLFDGAKALDRAGDVGRGAGRAKNKLGPDSSAKGSHSSFRRDSEGRINHYETYDWNPKTQTWGSQKRFRGEGKSHGGVDPPLILERKPRKGSGARPTVPRKPEAWELPKGY